jgi:chitinase
MMIETYADGWSANLEEAMSSAIASVDFDSNANAMSVVFRNKNQKTYTYSVNNDADVKFLQAVEEVAKGNSDFSVGVTFNNLLRSNSLTLIA